MVAGCGKGHVGMWAVPCSYSIDRSTFAGSAPIRARGRGRGEGCVAWGACACMSVRARARCVCEGEGEGGGGGKGVVGFHTSRFIVFDQAASGVD